MNANKKTITLLGIAVGSLLLVAGLYFFLFSAMKGKTEATIPLTERIDELSGKESRMSASLAILKDQTENINKLASSFFNTDQIVDFTKKIEALGADSRTTLSLQSLDQGTGDKSAPTLTFRLHATGKFTDIQRLLLLLENFPGKLDWSSVSMSAGGVAEGSTTPVWNVDMSLTALNFVNQ